MCCHIRAACARKQTSYGNVNGVKQGYCHPLSFMEEIPESINCDEDLPVFCKVLSKDRTSRDRKVFSSTKLGGSDTFNING